MILKTTAVPPGKEAIYWTSIMCKQTQRSGRFQKERCAASGPLANDPPPHPVPRSRPPCTCYQRLILRDRPHPRGAPAGAAGRTCVDQVAAVAAAQDRAPPTRAPSSPCARARALPAPREPRGNCWAPRPERRGGARGNAELTLWGPSPPLDAVARVTERHFRSPSSRPASPY